ncbi:MAG: type II toxin-antitoxin system VapC family toxin [Fimbriiglobus sp.]
MVYLDANVVIRLIEGMPAIKAPIASRLAPYQSVASSLITSRLTCMECRVQPLRTRDTILLALYQKFFVSPETFVVELSPVVVEKATEIRAELRLKPLDSLHLATAILAGASAFLTGDKALARCTEVPVEVL